MCRIIAGVSFVLLVLGLSAGIGKAEDVTYDDSASLQTAPWFALNDSVFPGTPGSPGFNGNNVTVNYSTNSDPDYVLGGLSNANPVTGNSVYILGTSLAGITNDVYGGWSTAGYAITDNHVTMLDGRASRIFGGCASGADVSGNTVTINGGSAGEIYGGLAPSSGNTVNNHVTISNGSIGGTVYGGKAHLSATGNSVTVSGGTLPATLLYGGWSDSGLASGNNVNISGGTLNGVRVYGGFVNSSLGGDSKNNNVTITGGTHANLVVIGGAAYDGDATYNTVTIGGNFSSTGHNLIGGHIDYGFSVKDKFTGNTLNIKNSGLLIENFENFQYLNFYLPSGMQAGETMLTITSGMGTRLNNGAGTASTINVGIDGGATPLKKGDSITLIDASAGSLDTAGINTTADGTGMQGVTLSYKFALAAVGNKLMATVTGEGATVNKQTKALSEGFLGGAALLGQGADLAAGQGTESAMRAAAASGSGGAGLAGFGGISAGSMRYNTGSHVDVNSVSMLAGIAKGFDAAPGRLTTGAFFEWGNGSYDTYNSFANSPSIKGDGNTYYLGGGLLARLDFADTGPGNFYSEISGRMGKAHNEYDNSDMKDSQGRNAHYDSSSLYYGLHVGGGYIWNILEEASLDLYAKYFWTRQEGDSVTLSSGESMHFKKVDSQRTRLGARFTYVLNEYVSPYAGAAWEHEFDSKARSTVNGLGVDSPSIEGDTGVGELGLNISPAPALPLTIGLGVQGYTGKREGVTGSLDLKWEF